MIDNAGSLRMGDTKKIVVNQNIVFYQVSVLATIQETVFMCETAARISSCKSLSQSQELGSHD